MQSDLFDEEASAGLPGMRFVPGFLSEAEAGELLRILGTLTLAEARYKDYTARRRVASFGGQFDHEALVLRAGPPMPAAFAPLRAKVAARFGVDADVFTQLLVAEYRPGTPLGWHRDVPDFESIVGISLQGVATMKFRRYPHATGDRSPVMQLELPPRSLYLIEGEARWNWQHSVAPTRALRYSITLRTRRGTARLLGSDRN